MTSLRRLFVLAGLVLVIGLTTAAASLPARVGDQEFWRLVSESSEPDGVFRSDNLLSNELGFQFVVPELARTTKAGRAYMGVGPEQNFTYIVATKPAMAFIVDIRRGNLDLHLMYKALFELSADRAEFVSRLFSKKRPEGLSAKSTSSDIFGAFWTVTTDPMLFNENLQAIGNLLVKKHGFTLSSDDMEGIKYVYNAFFQYGPKIQYSSTSSFGSSQQPTYADLMTAADLTGVERGYLASEENFQFLKDLESRNLVVPVVGNFGGPKAIRAVGKYLKDRDAIVSAFYLSNVEQYLRQDLIWDNFCANVATLPLDETSTFIRSVRRGNSAPGIGLSSELANMPSEVKSCRP
ncbi:MAG TPA: hypothetical protein VGJ39_00085 [Vicinamibacterales bacterium]